MEFRPGIEYLTAFKTAWKGRSCADKTVYHSVNKVKETLMKRKMEFCLNTESSTESSVEEISDFEDQ